MNCSVIIERIESAISESRRLLAQETNPERSRRIREGILFLANGVTMFEWLEETAVAKPKVKRRPAEFCTLRP